MQKIPLELIKPKKPAKEKPKRIKHEYVVRQGITLLPAGGGSMLRKTQSRRLA
jgi:hypothetical protein